jgi:hypothetical protein
MLTNKTSRVFLLGTLCGAVLLAVVWVASVWWTRLQRSAEEEKFYDACLEMQQGNAVICDGWMRMLDRERAEEMAAQRKP